MVFREKFTPTEWETLQFAPLWVHTTVGFIDGKVDTHETDALADEIRKASFWKNDLAREVLTSIKDDLEITLQKYIADPRGVREGLTQVTDILAKKTDPETSLGFKKTLIVLSKHTAEASGGWIGSKWTGSSTSPEENNAIQFIFKTLEISEEDVNSIL